MLAVGLTGGIGSGKSTVASIFSVLGIPVFDADRQAKLLMEEEGTMKAIRQHFGEHIYINGKLDRKALSAIVFSDPFQLDKLNAIVHPATIAAANNWFLRQTTPYAIKEAALFFEAGSTQGLNVIVGVSAPKALRIHRAMQRDNVTRQEVLDRMNRQIDADLKMKLCDYVLVNDEQQLLIPQVLKLHSKLIEQSMEARS